MSFIGMPFNVTIASRAFAYVRPKDAFREYSPRLRPIKRSQVRPRRHSQRAPSWTPADKPRLTAIGMIFNDHEFIFPEGECIGTGFQELPSSPRLPYSDISSSPFLVASVDRYVRPRSAPPFPVSGNPSPLSDSAPEAPICHTTPLLPSRIRFIDENRSVCSGQDTKHDESKHIPRPPNAFMLYRSDFLKQGVIPPEIEKRQQNLSRIAGQCWNMLSESEKAIWHDKAAAIQAAHYAKYPSYKFRPSRKEAGKRSAKEKRDSRLADRGKAFIRSLREEHAAVAGHSSGPINRSRTRQRRPHKSPYRESMFAALRDSLPSSDLSPDTLSSTPSESPSSASSSLSPLSPLSLPTLLPPFTSLSHSCGPDSSQVAYHSLFSRRHKIDYQLGPAIDTPHMGLSDMIRGLEITPTVITPSQVPHPMLHPGYQDSFGSYVPTLGQFPALQNDSMFQVHLALPESNPCSPSGYRAGGLHLQTTDFRGVHTFAHYNPSDVSWYPCHSNTENGDMLSDSWMTPGRL